MTPFSAPGIIETTTPNNIICQVCTAYGTTREELLRHNGTRFQPWAEIRQVCMYIMRKKTKLSYKHIASYFNRDHATALHSARLVEDMLRFNREFRKRVEGVV